MATTTVESLHLDLAELEKFEKEATRQKVKEIMQVEICKLQRELHKKQEQAKGNTEQQTQSSGDSAAKSHHSSRSVVSMTSYGWDQSEKFMKIYVSLNGVQHISKDNISVSFAEKGFCLRCNDIDNKDHQLVITRLFEKIVPEDSYHKLKTDMVLLMLKKKEQGKTWAYVTEREGAKKEKKKPETSDTADPSESMMGLIRQMYEEGDDEMKRSISKAWSTSRNQVPDL